MTLPDTAEVAIIGAGAAGLMAAIFAGREAARVVALDGASRLGAKILISGGGRCNVTHHEVTANDFHGSRNAIAKVLRTFPVAETVDFFREIGVELKHEESGKLFPRTDRAATVLDALVRAARDAGAAIVTGARVDAVEQVAGGFELHTTAGTVSARRVIVATGGRSVPKTGSDGRGYELVRRLGHSVNGTFPALVPLVMAESHWTRRVSGTSADVELTVTSSSGRVLERVSGAMLCTHFGVSGPAVLDVSRHWIAARRADDGAGLAVNFLPGESPESIDRELLDASRRNPRATVSSALRGRVPDRIIDAIAPEGPIARLTRDERKRAARELTAQPLPVGRDRGFDYAEVTAGGVPLEEVDLRTMESRKAAGLYLCGEILDVDGRVGGFNFQWAWATGRLAGRAAAVGFASLHGG